jgi:hypothetical protein
MSRTLSILALLVPTTLAFAQSQRPAPTANRPAPAPSSSTPAPSGTGVGDLKFDSVPLRDALDQIQDRTGLNMHVNWAALEANGITPDKPVTLRVRNVTARKALQLVLQSAAPDRSVTFYVDGGIVEVTTQALADEQLITRVYPIGDLLLSQEDFDQVPFIDIAQQQTVSRGGGGGQNPIQSGGRPDPTKLRDDRLKKQQEIIDMITTSIRPEVWQVNGGRSTIAVFNSNLIVTAPRSVHQLLGGPRDLAPTPALKAR